MDLAQAQVGPADGRGARAGAVLRDTQPGVSVCVRAGGSVSLRLTPGQQRPPLRACRNEATLQVTPSQACLSISDTSQERFFFFELSLGQTLNQMVQ